MANSSLCVGIFYSLSQPSAIKTPNDSYKNIKYAKIAFKMSVQKLIGNTFTFFTAVDCVNQVKART